MKYFHPHPEALLVVLCVYWWDLCAPQASVPACYATSLPDARRYVFDVTSFPLGYQLPYCRSLFTEPHLL